MILLFIIFGFLTMYVMLPYIIIRRMKPVSFKGTMGILTAGGFIFNIIGVIMLAFIFYIVSSVFLVWIENGWDCVVMLIKKTGFFGFVDDFTGQMREKIGAGEIIGYGSGILFISFSEGALGTLILSKITNVKSRIPKEYIENGGNKIGTVIRKDKKNIFVSAEGVFYTLPKKYRGLEEGQEVEIRVLDGKDRCYLM